MISTGGISYADLRELINKTGMQAGADGVFLPQLFQQAGYVTGQIGKLDWGFATTPERLERHGWDYHYGYYDHVRCHGFYPPFLFENGRRVDVPGNTHVDCAKHPETESAEHARNRHDRTGKDGVSLLPVWRGREPEQEHGAIVYASFLWGPSRVTADGWKLRRINKLDRFQLYYMPDDYQEEHDLAAQYPERVAALAARMLEACDGSYDRPIRP